jgi:integrase
MQYISDFLKGTKDSDGNDLTSGFTTRATQLGYRAAVYAFLDHRYGNVRKKKDSTPEEREQYEKLAAKYLKGKVNPLVDLKGYKNYLTSLKRPPHSISQGVTCVRIWLEHYEHGLNSKDMRELKKHLPSQRTGVTREGELSPEIIRSILAHTGDTRLRAAILVMTTSGIRVGELSGLTSRDVDLPKNTIHISDLVAKGGIQRTTFITDEAKEALAEYIKDRVGYINRAKRLTPNLKKQYRESEKLFPMTDKTIRNGLNGALKRAGLYETDSRTNRTTVHPHSFRKYFSSTLKLAGMPEDITEVLMGHSTQLSTAYRVYSDRQLKEKYDQYSHVLNIGDFGYGVRQELKSRMNGQDEEIKQLRREKEELKERLVMVEQAQATKQKIEETDLFKQVMAAVEAKLKK